MTQTQLNTLFDNFLWQFNNKSVDFDGVYGAQCFDLIQEWNVHWLSNPFISGAVAKQIWDSEHQGYTRVSNSPNNSPQKGDIVVWSGWYNGVLGRGPGHTGVATGKGDVWTFECFVQNDPTGSVSHARIYNYNSILGWFRPNITLQPLTDAQKLEKIKTIAFSNAPEGNKVNDIKLVFS